MTYGFLQQYWWFIVSLLGSLFVMLTLVQGANTQIFSLGKTEAEREMIVNSTGRKWEFTFTTLVTFGGAFFASFPLFYSTSFGGAYWVWMLILFSFVLQAVAYEYQSKPGNVYGKNVYRSFLVINGIAGPLLVGTAVGTFFNGAEFTVDKDVMGLGSGAISQWASCWHGLEAVANPWNVMLGLAVMFLSMTLGLLYLINNVADETLRERAAVHLRVPAAGFVLTFVLFLLHVVLKDGYAVDSDGVIFMEPYKYLNNLLEMWPLLLILLVGVVLALYGIGRTLFQKQYTQGIWSAGLGTVLAVLVLLLIAGWNGTAYYPSNADLQSSLTLENSCSSEFTLTVMTVVTILVPFVLAYIAWAWRSIDRKPITPEELAQEEHKY